MNLQWLKKGLDALQPPAGRVLLWGAVGGMLAVLATVVRGEQLLAPWYVMFLAYTLLGSGAAFAAVFVLLGTNSQDVLRCSGVALLAGFFWSPVFDAGKEYVLAKPDRAAEDPVKAETQELEQTITKLRASPASPDLIRRAGILAESLTEQAADLRRGPVRTRALSTLTRALDEITANAKQDDAEALEAIANVAETAAKTGNRQVAERAVRSIDRIPVTKDSPVDRRKKEMRIGLPGNR